MRPSSGFIFTLHKSLYKKFSSGYIVNTMGVSPVSTGLVERLMSASIGAAMFSGEGCNLIGSAVQVQVLVLCASGQIRVGSTHPRNNVSDLDNKVIDESK